MKIHHPPTSDLFLRLSQTLHQGAYVLHLRDDSVQWLSENDVFLQQCALAGVHKGSDLERRLCGKNAPNRQALMENATREQSPWQMEHTLTDETGQRIRLLETGCYAEEAGEKVIYGLLQNITAMQREQDKSRHSGSYDEMTGLYNKFRLSEMLEHALSYTSRYKGNGAYLSIGIDRLAEINGSFGYETGDMVMINLCHRLRKALRDADVIGRIEGDRIGIILFNCHEHDIATACERFLQIVNANPIDTPHGPLQVSISIGAILFPQQADTMFDCLRRSDQALTTAKKLGRNRYAIYDVRAENTDEEVNKAQAIGAMIRRAVKEEQFCLAFQPILNVETGKVVTYECLLRINRGKGEIINAGAFIATAEQLGLITSIDRQVLKMAVKELVDEPSISLTFNISGLTVGSKEWLQDLETSVKANPDIAARMIVEITETAAFGEGANAGEFVRQIRRMGCKVALDDFGAGYTSFRQLQTIPADYIKIDGSFVREFATDESSQVFVRTMLDLAHAFNLAVIAEGVETEEHKRVMQEEGIILHQGYLYAKPTIERPWKCVSTAVAAAVA